MKKAHLTQQALGAALGISQPAVSQLARRGMPVDSVESARQWRAENLEPTLPKETRALLHGTAACPVADAANALAQHLDELLGTGQPVDALRPTMRQTLRAVPFDSRDQVAMSTQLWGLLLTQDLPKLTEPGPPGTAPLGDVEKQVMGWVCYSLAAGEVQL